MVNLTASYIPNPFNQVISFLVQVEMTADGGERQSCDGIDRGQ
jgi:hypothetical protein